MSGGPELPLAAVEVLVELGLPMPLLMAVVGVIDMSELLPLEVVEVLVELGLPMP